MQTSFAFEAIGTKWQIDCDNSELIIDNLQLEQKIKSFIDVFDKNYSRFREDSLITRISKKEGVYKLPPDAKKMFVFYRKLYDLTNGIVTPLIGNLMEETGYDARYSLVSKELHHPKKWDETLEYNHPELKVKVPVLLDFGAAGKGYLVDLVGQILKENGVNNFCIDAGGDILYSNTKSKQLTVGLEHPDNTTQAIGTIDIANESICGSAANRRRWGKFNHIVNPHTLKPVKHIKAIWIIAKEAMVADGLATALFFVDPKILEKKFSFKYLILYNDLSFKKSNDFNAQLFLK